MGKIKGLECRPAEILKDLIALLVDAEGAQKLVLANPGLSLNQLGKTENRCRTHLVRLLRLSWLSPRIVETIVTGAQPDRINRHALLLNAISRDWAEQERQFGHCA
ncbi:hypothetical protein [uncultured Erythrobacter sp.]|uniref:hypothetical protein n=1 Tax=uncultured Erythrobacter sp. TaxID=263913 RepID=UPI0026599E1B|nr:hypothetical protein [uncultured Erythrobacter sp.]